MNKQTIKYTIKAVIYETDLQCNKTMHIYSFYLKFSVSDNAEVRQR